MCIVSNDLVAGSHVADYISLRIDLNLIESDLLHLRGDGVDMSLLITALARVLYDGTQESGHILLIPSGSFLNLVKIKHF